MNVSQMSIYVVKRDLDAVATKAGTETLTTGIWVIEICGDTSLVASKIFPVFPSKQKLSSDIPSH